MAYVFIAMDASVALKANDRSFVHPVNHQIMVEVALIYS